MGVSQQDGDEHVGCEDDVELEIWLLWPMPCAGSPHAHGAASAGGKASASSQRSDNTFPKGAVVSPRDQIYSFDNILKK